MKLSQFEFQVWQKLRELGVRETTLLLALSGGIDSVVLVHVLAKLASRLQLKIKLCHIHHGVALTPYRDEAQAFCQTLAVNYHLPFFTNCAFEQNLKSESELRDYRLQLLKEFASIENCQWIVLGHHWDDLTETRLMRLIRGTSLQGLRAMEEKKQMWLRPLLQITRAELTAYAKSESLAWLDDPSNDDHSFFRNWLRGEWLPQLESRQPGAVRRLGASLQAMVEASIKELCLEDYLHAEGGIDLLRLRSLPRERAGELLALYLRSLSVHAYTRGHLREILKRLDSSQKELTFVVGGLVWSCNAQRLSACHPPKH